MFALKQKKPHYSNSTLNSVPSFEVCTFVAFTHAFNHLVEHLLVSHVITMPIVPAHRWCWLVHGGSYALPKLLLIFGYSYSH